MKRTAKSLLKNNKSKLCLFFTEELTLNPESMIDRLIRSDKSEFYSYGGEYYTISWGKLPIGGNFVEKDTYFCLFDTLFRITCLCWIKECRRIILLSEIRRISYEEKTSRRISGKALFKQLINEERNLVLLKWKNSQSKA